MNEGDANDEEGNGEQDDQQHAEPGVNAERASRFPVVAVGIESKEQDPHEDHHDDEEEDGDRIREGKRRGDDGGD